MSIYKTISANKSTVSSNWYIINAENKVVGRLATKVAGLLKGKHKPYYTPHVDCGDHVIILNSGKVRFTGNKLTEKKYIRYSGHPGGQKVSSPDKLLTTKPAEVIEHAVRGMLPKTKLGRAMFRKLHVYSGTEHPHEAQQPIDLNLPK